MNDNVTHTDIVMNSTDVITLTPGTESIMQIGSTKPRGVWRCPKGHEAVMDSEPSATGDMGDLSITVPFCAICMVEYIGKKFPIKRVV